MVRIWLFKNGQIQLVGILLLRWSNLELLDIKIKKVIPQVDPCCILEKKKFNSLGDFCAVLILTLKTAFAHSSQVAPKNCCHLSQTSADNSCFLRVAGAKGHADSWLSPCWKSISVAHRFVVTILHNSNSRSIDTCTHSLSLFQPLSLLSSSSPLSVLFDPSLSLTSPSLPRPRLSVSPGFIWFLCCRGATTVNTLAKRADKIAGVNICAAFCHAKLRVWRSHFWRLWSYPGSGVYIHAWLQHMLSSHHCLHGKY